MAAPASPARGPVEKKVTWASIGTYLGTVAVLAVLNTVGDNPSLISGLPDWLETLVLPVIPAAVAFVSGYRAKHTPRPAEVPPAGPVSETPYRDGYGTRPDTYGA